jgi:hypothetical protein
VNVSYDGANATAGTIKTCARNGKIWTTLLAGWYLDISSRIGCVLDGPYRVLRLGSSLNAIHVVPQEIADGNGNIPNLAELVRIAGRDRQSDDGHRYRPAAHGVGPSVDDGRRRAARLRTAIGVGPHVNGACRRPSFPCRRTPSRMIPACRSVRSPGPPRLDQPYWLRASNPPVGPRISRQLARAAHHHPPAEPTERGSPMRPCAQGDPSLGEQQRRRSVVGRKHCRCHSSCPSQGSFSGHSLCPSFLSSVAEAIGGNRGATRRFTETDTTLP